MRSCASCWRNSFIARTACSPIIRITVSSAPVLRLASVSPRRRELLTQIGVPHVVTGAHIDETVHPGERARDYVQRMARTKAQTVWEQDLSLPVLAADTTVVLEGSVFGKP